MAYKSVGYVKETAFESQSRQKQILYSEGISNIIEENDRANPNILKRKGIKQCLNVLAGYELWVTSIAVISSDLSDIIEVADKLQQACIFLKSRDKKDEWVQCLIYPKYREFLNGAIDIS